MDSEQEVNVADHLGLIHHTINRLHVPFHLRDEAYSEGLVILALAAMSWDSGRGVPAGAFIATRLRWGIINWMRKEYEHNTSELREHHKTLSHSEQLEARRLLDQVIYVAARRLNAPEYIALLGAVYGARQSELSNILSKNAEQLDALRASARAKIKHELKLL